MADLTVPKGDYGYDLAFTITTATGVVYNIASYSTIKFNVWYKGSYATPLITGACVIDGGGTTGQCHYTVLNTDFTKAGNYLFELQLAKTGVVESTKTYTLRVEESV